MVHDECCLLVLTVFDGLVIYLLGVQHVVYWFELIEASSQVAVGAAAPSMAPCPYRVSAFKKAVRMFAKNPSNNVITPALGTSIDSLGEAYNL